MYPSHAWPRPSHTLLLVVSLNIDASRYSGHEFVAVRGHAQRRAYPLLAVGLTGCAGHALPQQVVQSHGPARDARAWFLGVVQEVHHLVERRHVAKVGANAQPLQPPVELDGARRFDLVL